MQKYLKRSIVATILATVGFMGCSRTPAQNAARDIDQGKSFLEKKDYARAILAFRNASKADPKNAEPYYQLALISLDAGDPWSAASTLRKATELDPKHAAAQTKLAELMTTARSKDVLEDAQKRLQEVLKTSPDSIKALDTLALAEVRLGEPDLAEQHLKEALQKFPQDLKTSASLAGLKVNRGDLKGAEEILKRTVALAPQSANARILLAELYRSINRPAEAEEQFRAASKLDPKNAVALIGISALEQRAGHAEQAEETLRQLSSFPDERYKPMHALYLYQSGKKEAAIAEFEKLAGENPKDRAARTRLIAAYLQAARTADAEKAITKTLLSNPKDGDALLQRSEIYLRMGKFQEAQNDLNRVLKQQADSGYAHYLLAIAHEAQGASLQVSQELGEAVRLKPDLLVARLDWASRLTAAGKASTALTLLDQAPVAQRKLPALLAQRNAALWAMGEKAELRKGIDAGLAISRSPDFLLQDAQLKLSQGNYSGAEASLQQASRLAPDDPRPVEALADSYAAQKQNSKALDLVRRFATARLKSAEAQKLLAAWLLRQGDHAGARSAFEAAKAVDPAFADTDLALAQLDIAEGKLDSARDRLTQGLGTLGGKAATGLSVEVLLGNLEVKAGHLDKAIEHYRRVVGLNPTNTLAMNNLAFLLADYANQPDEALQLAQRAKELDPNNPDVADTIGWAYYRKGIYRTAVEYLTVAAVTGSPLTKYHLAMAYLRVGERDRGQRVFQEALRLNPNLPEARMAGDVLGETSRAGR